MNIAEIYNKKSCKYVCYFSILKLPDGFSEHSGNLFVGVEVHLLTLSWICYPSFFHCAITIEDAMITLNQIPT